MSRRALCCLLALIAVSTTTLFVLAAPRKGGVKYALLIGVRAYEPTELRDFPYAENDITDLARVLVEQGGYDRRHVVLMTQCEAAEKPRVNPTAANIRRQLDILLKRCDSSPRRSSPNYTPTRELSFGRWAARP